MNENATKERVLDVNVGDTLNYTLSLTDGRTLLLNVRNLSKHSVSLGVSAAIALPQPDQVIELVPREDMA